MSENTEPPANDAPANCLCGKIKAWARETEAFAAYRESRGDTSAADASRVAVSRLLEILSDREPADKPPLDGKERIYLLNFEESDHPFLVNSYFSAIQSLMADIEDLEDGDSMKFVVKREDMTGAQIEALPEFGG